MIPLSSLLAQGTFWLDPPASTSAKNHDLVFYALLSVMGFFFFLVVAIMLTFVVQYRRRKGRTYDDAPTHNTPLEIFWTVIPLGLVIGFFVIGLRYYVELEAPPPEGADVIDVEASQWQFNFKYRNGAESNELYLLVNRPVVLNLTSADVTHALYIPAFRVQRNALPGRKTELWFQPTVPTGSESFYHVFCTQYCGNGHADMNTKAFVLNQEDYDKKLAEAANIFEFVDPVTKKREALPYAKVGEKLYATRGCAACHSVDGSEGHTGPTWKGLYKRDVEFSETDVPGYTLRESDDDKKWDAYLRESILHPAAKIVKGYQNAMPSKESEFSGSPGNEMKLQAIIEYIKSLGKDYKPMKTPELPSGEKPPAGEKRAAGEKLPVGDKPPAADRFADRPADLPADKSAPAVSPAATKDEGK
jgi:cytochrome c oxidase subunit 2